MHRDATLKQLAKTVASLQSFEYDTFDAARETVNIDGAEYVFDKLSLCEYVHNLSARDYRTFGEYLCQFLEEDRSSDDMKAREEYAVLSRPSLPTAITIKRSSSSTTTAARSPSKMVKARLSFTSIRATMM